MVAGRSVFGPTSGWLPTSSRCLHPHDHRCHRRSTGWGDRGVDSHRWCRRAARSRRPSGWPSSASYQATQAQLVGRPRGAWLARRQHRRHPNPARSTRTRPRRSIATMFVAVVFVDMTRFTRSGIMVPAATRRTWSPPCRRAASRHVPGATHPQARDTFARSATSLGVTATDRVAGAVTPGTCCRSCQPWRRPSNVLRLARAPPPKHHPGTAYRQARAGWRSHRQLPGWHSKRICHDRKLVAAATNAVGTVPVIDRG